MTTYEDKQLREQYKEDFAKWENAQDWSQLIQLNREFILDSRAGKCVTTPYWLSPLFDETTPLIDALLRLHDLGLLTTGSQPQISSKIGEDDEGYYECKQIPFVDFMVPRGEAVLPLVEKLLEDKELICQVIELGPGLSRFWPGSYTERVEVTHYRIGQSKEQLPSAKWIVQTTFPKEPLALEDTSFDELPSTKEKYFFWCIIATRDDIDLLRRVEDHAIEAGLTMSKAEQAFESATSSHANGVDSSENTE